MNNDELAFEYALGTLRGEQRSAVERRLNSDLPLAAEILFWQQQLMAMQTPQSLTPQADTWARIEAKLEPQSHDLHKGRRYGSSLLHGWWPTVLASILFLMIGVVVSLWQYRVFEHQPNADYVAVLTSPDGQAKLTALTSVDGQKLWLRWQALTPRAGYSLQLWAVSKRDGEVRSLMVISEPDVGEATLDAANSRLIQDAAELLLTEEESGGSALDQPSEVLIAKGVCVRLRSG